MAGAPAIILDHEGHNLGMAEERDKESWFFDAVCFELPTLAFLHRFFSVFYLLSSKNSIKELKMMSSSFFFF